MRKLNLLGLAVLSLTVSAGVFAHDYTLEEHGNICDRMIKAGKSKAAIEKCYKDFGKSKFKKAKDKAAKERGEQIANSEAEAIEAAAKKEADRKKYIIKSFSGSEVMHLEFSYFVAQVTVNQIDVDNKMTSPKELCEYLGYEDAISDQENVGYTLSDDISNGWEKNASYEGVYVNTFGNVKPFMKKSEWNSIQDYKVKHYTKIVCKRLRKTVEEVQSEEMQRAIRLVISAQEKPEADRDGEEQIDVSRGQSEEIRRILEDKRGSKRNTDRFTHKGSSK